MKKYIIWLIPIAIIATFLGMLLSPSHNNASYRFSGELEDGLNSIQVQVFLIQNNEGNLLNYYTDIYNSEEEIKGAQIYYLENEEKHTILGNSLNGYDLSANKSEYGYDYLDEVIANKDNLYFDLCNNTKCTTIFKTIKLEASKLY